MRLCVCALVRVLAESPARLRDELALHEQQAEARTAELVAQAAEEEEAHVVRSALSLRTVDATD